MDKGVVKEENWAVSPKANLSPFSNLNLSPPTINDNLKALLKLVSLLKNSMYLLTANCSEGAVNPADMVAPVQDSH